MVMDKLVPAVEELLRNVAEQEVMSRFGRLSEGDVRHKGKHGDLVTAADLEAENRIREGLLRLLPDSIVIGEEGCFKTPEILDKLNGDDPVWVVDPVDGTRNFARGKPCFAVMVALIEHGETRLGWILDPISGACATVEKGRGAFVSGQKMNLSQLADNTGGLGNLIGSVGDGVKNRLLARQEKGEDGLPKHLVRYHCAGREYMDLALGKIHFALYGGQMMPWDHAAGTLLVTEAGGYARTIGDKKIYDPRHHGHGKRLLMAPDEATFDALCSLFA
jgi:fructose-1,6-bisphosphatase/inositol monophosphatase family enzyme